MSTVKIHLTDCHVITYNIRKKYIIMYNAYCRTKIGIIFCFNIGVDFSKYNSNRNQEFVRNLYSMRDQCSNYILTKRLMITNKFHPMKNTKTMV